MDKPIETIEYKGYEIEIYQDDDSVDPISDFYWMGKMICWHRNYNIGHKHKYDDPDEFKKEIVIEADPTVEYRIDHWENGNGWRYLANKYCDYRKQGFNPIDKAVELSNENIQNIINKALDKYYIMLDIYMYDHSGITIRTNPFNCRWDSGQIGYIYVSKEKVKKEYKWKLLTKKRIKQIEEHLKNEVKTYDQYITGEVYTYRINDPITNEIIDSCSGFYGTDFNKNDLMEMAKSSIDCEIMEREEKRSLATIKEIGEMYF